MVFDGDWEFTKDAIANKYLIDSQGTFVKPSVDDESNNWGNRGSLLEAYRNLLSLLRTRGTPIHEAYVQQ